MESESRPEAPAVTYADLEEALRKEAPSFDFFQVVRLLRLLRPGGEGVGGFALPRNETVRFSTNPGLGFPAGEVQDLDWDEEEAPRLEVNFLGLVGNQGVLPLHYSRKVLALEEGESNPLRDFLDIFQHRILSLFYRAMEKGRFWAAFERREPDSVSTRLIQLLGLDAPALRNRLQVPDEHLLYYAGLMAPHQRNAAALERAIGDFFQVPATVREFVGGWFPVSPESQCRLDDEVDELSPRLGEHTVVGDEIWDPQARVRIILGPLSRERYEDFLPGGASRDALKTFATFLSDDHFEFELQLILAREDVPPVVLGAQGPEANPLGWCSWIRTRPFDRDADETILAL